MTKGIELVVEDASSTGHHRLRGAARYCCAMPWRRGAGERVLHLDGNKRVARVIVSGQWAGD